jgi:VanZ family protein
MRIALAWLPAHGYMLLIWLLSSRTQPVDLSDVPFHDKGVHFVEYAVLGLLIARAVRRTWPALTGARFGAAVCLPTIAWGYLDELHQAFVPGRFSSMADLLADALGALIGLGLFLLFEQLRGRLLSRNRG